MWRGWYKGKFCRVQRVDPELRYINDEPDIKTGCIVFVWMGAHRTSSMALSLFFPLLLSSSFPPFLRFSPCLPRKFEANHPTLFLFLLLLTLFISLDASPTPLLHIWRFTIGHVTIFFFVYKSLRPPLLLGFPPSPNLSIPSPFLLFFPQIRRDQSAISLDRLSLSWVLPSDPISHSNFEFLHGDRED